MATTARTTGLLLLERGAALGSGPVLLARRSIAYASKGATEVNPQPKDKSRTVQSFYNQSAIDVAAAKVRLP